MTLDINANLFGDSTAKLLEEVDLKLSTTNDIENFKKKYFINFLALLGECIIKINTSFYWQMKLSSYDGETWTPYLSNGDLNVSDDLFMERFF